MTKRRNQPVIHPPVVWVTGASRGIGREIAIQFASIGCNVCLSSRNVRRLDQIVAEIKKMGGNAHTFPVDIARPQSIDRVVNRISTQIGKIDILVNNAGMTVFKSFLSTSLEEFQTIIATNLYGHIACIKAVLPSMVKDRSGWIFNIISNAAVKTFEGSSAYTATKAGMLGVGRVLREEMRRHQIRVVNIIPGATETEMWKPVMRKQFGRRMMRPQSVAETVLAVYQMPDDLVVDEILFRPIQGDISV